VVLATVVSAWAQEDLPDVVSTIRIEGNEEIPDGMILSRLRSRAGQQFNPQVVRQDERRLLETRWFDRVASLVRRTDRGVELIFQVKEQEGIRRLREVRFEGNEQLAERKLERELPFAAGEPVTGVTAQAGLQALLEAYRSEGFHRAEVTFDPNGLRRSGVLVYAIREGPRAYLDDIHIRGNTYFTSLWLRLSMVSKERFWPFVRGAYNPEQLQRDVEMIRNKYIAEGFLDAEVALLPPAFDDERREVEITIVIKEGPRFRVNEVIFKGTTVFRGEDLRERLALQRGEFATAESLQRDVEKIENTYGEVGFIDARVQLRKVFVDPRSELPDWARDLDTPGLVDLEYTVTEADQYRIGMIDIRGNDVTQTRVIRRELTFFPEQLYNAVAVEDSKGRLLDSTLFSKVKIEPTNRFGDIVDVLVEVEETESGRMMFGVGLSSNSGLVGTISITERNFDITNPPTSWRDVTAGRGLRGAGQYFNIAAEPGTELSRYFVDWREPYLFDLPYSLGTRGYFYTRDQGEYNETRYGGVVSLGHRFPNRWYAEVSSRIEGVVIDEIDPWAVPEILAVEGSHALLGLKGTLVRDRTNSAWLPTRGDRLRLSYEQVMGDFHFGVLESSYNIYKTVYLDAFDRPHIVSGRARVGYIFSEAPVFERFYGGGLGSVRGFSYRGISPRSLGTDTPIGGEFLTFLGVEYTFPLVAEQLRGVLFVDTGTVEEGFEIDTYRASTGFGIRWTIPFFGQVPMSFDFGFPIVKDDQDDTQVFTFTLGWSY
jgi:outer membrane protein assembly complex protein YaeT